MGVSKYLSTLTADSQLSVIKINPSLAEIALPSLTELFRKLNLSFSNYYDFSELQLRKCPKMAAMSWSLHIILLMLD